MRWHWVRGHDGHPENERCDELANEAIRAAARQRQRRARAGVTVRAPHGAWRSPITAARVAVASAGLGGLAVDGDAIYWLEGRPAEGGRSVLVRWRAGAAPST